MSDEPMIVDAKRQQDFDKTLLSRTAAIEKLVHRFDAQLGQLGNDWQDIQFKEFSHQALVMVRAVERFTAASRKLSGNLKQSIKRAEEYAKIKEV